MSSTFPPEALLWLRHHARGELGEKQAPVKRAHLSRTINTNSKHHHQPVAANTLTMQTAAAARAASNRMILKTTLSLIVIVLALSATSVRCQENYGPDNEQLDSSSAIPSGELGSQQQQQLRQVSISTEPNKMVRIECKLPQLVVAQSNGTSDRTFYWNFQRTSSDRQSSKPDLLCWGVTCYDTKKRGIELEFDRATGDYNLLIRNATFKENDGIYYCEYRDTSSEISHSTEIQLTILIPPQPPTISPSVQISPREGQEYQLNCQSYGGNPEPNITWFKNEQALLPGNGVRIDQSRHNGTATSTLIWIPTIEDHNATYRCSVTNRAMSLPLAYERETTLHVEFAPRISVGPYNPLRVIQGDSATLSCQVDAHPPVKGIKWYRDGQLVSNQYNHTIYDVKISDSGVYSCQADNGIAPVVLLSGSSGPIIAPASGQTNTASSFLSYLGLSNSAGHDLAPKTLSQAQLVLDVLYAPRVRIQESRSQPLSEQETSYSLNCSVDSSPPPYEFVWTKQEDGQTVRTIQNSPSPTLEFGPINANDMGNYTCTAYNRLEPSNRDKHAQERSGSASLRVLVRHKPGVGEISIGLDGETEKGNRTEIQCRAKPPGYPEPKYSFWKLSGSDKKQIQSKQSNSVYTIHSAKADDEAGYMCVVWNELGQSTDATGELIVNEVPTITRLNSDMWSPSVERAPGSAHVLTIQATGKPEPKVRWFHRSPLDGHRIELSSAEMQTKFHISVQSTPDPMTTGRRHQYSVANLSPAALAARQRYTVISTLTFKQPLDIEDRGLYWAEASNGLSRTAVEEHQLLIPHSPIVAPRQMLPIRSNSDNSKSNPKTSSVETRAGYNLGEQVNLTCRVSSWPMPQFVWFHQARGSNESPKQILMESPIYKSSLFNPYDDIFEHSISFQLMSESDYGGYLCAAANTDKQSGTLSPSINIVINLGPKTKPEPPVQVDQIDGTQDSVTIQWLPGFDGGYSQNEFIIQYAADDGSGLSLSPSAGLSVVQMFESMSGPTDSQQQQQSSKLFDCSTRNPCTITNLQPRQAYLMRVKAKNELGSSDYSDEIHVSTRADVFQIPLIQSAHFDASRNTLHYSLEQNPEYLLNYFEMRIEIKGGSNQALASSNSIQPMVAYASDQQQQVTGGGSVNQDWRRHLVMQLRAADGELAMNMSPATESLRLTLCSRTNESLCGQEFIVSTQSPNSLFLKDQRSLSMSILVISLFLLIVLIVTATTLHSRCLSRKAKKAAALDRTDHTANRSSDSKQPGGSLAGHINGGLNLANGTTKVGSGVNGSHGSTASTNSTSAGTNGGQGGQMQSLDSINQMNNQHLLNGGSSSDHSSDHSRQAKLDSMPPPNYSHYADRASLMLEQQHQAYLQDKLSSPFGLPANSLMSHNNNLGANGVGPADVNGQLMGDYYGGYGQNGATMTSMEHRQMLEATGAGGQHSMMMGSMLGYEPNDGQQMYSTHHQALVDDYNYNNAHLTSYPSNHQDQMIESAYGTTGATADGVVGLLDHQANASGLMMAQTTQASFDNSANQTYLGYPNASNYEDQQQQQQRHSDTASSQYQHDLAAAQQQMYGTLTRTNNSSQQANSSPNQSQGQQYLGASGLMPPPPLPPPPPPQESDYGTTGGGRNGGRLIREIIV